MSIDAIPIQCRICLEDLGDNAVSPCERSSEHRFHADCINRWIATSLNKGGDVPCPLCRQVIVSGAEGNIPDVLHSLAIQSAPERLVATLFEEREFHCAAVVGNFSRFTTLLETRLLCPEARGVAAVAAARRGDCAMVDRLLFFLDTPEVMYNGVFRLAAAQNNYSMLDLVHFGRILFAVFREAVISAASSERYATVTRLMQKAFPQTVRSLNFLPECLLESGLPIAWKNARANIDCNVGAGNTLAVCCEVPTWDLAMPLHGHGHLYWSGQLPVEKEFKFVIVRPDGSLVWEQGDNRVLQREDDIELFEADISF